MNFLGRNKLLDSFHSVNSIRRRYGYVNIIVQWEKGDGNVVEFLMEWTVVLVKIDV